MRPFILNSKKGWAIVVCLMVLLVAAGTTVAYLMSADNPVDNTFIPANVSCRVEETFSEGANVKENVSVRNIGNIPAYIRVTVVVNWVHGQTGAIHADAPRLGVDYTMEMAQGGWMQGSDGYWYYPNAVQPDALTGELISRVTCIQNGPEGYRLGVQILASAIQAQPAEAVAGVWNVIVENDTIRPKTTP